VTLKVAIFDYGAGNIFSLKNSLEKNGAQVDVITGLNKSKEYSDLNEIIKEAKEYESFEKDKIELEKIINDTTSDSDMKFMAKTELEKISNKHEINEKKLKLFLLPKDEADSKNAILEIRAGTGGLEATLFVADLYKMYEKVCLNNKHFYILLIYLRHQYKA